MTNADRSAPWMMLTIAWWLLEVFPKNSCHLDPSQSPGPKIVGEGGNIEAIQSPPPTTQSRELSLGSKWQEFLGKTSSAPFKDYAVPSSFSGVLVKFVPVFCPDPLAADGAVARLGRPSTLAEGFGLALSAANCSNPLARS
jgi:hypothetical protein